MRGETNRPEIHLPLAIRPRAEIVWLVIPLMILFGFFMITFGRMFLQLPPGDGRRLAGLLFEGLCAAIVLLAAATLGELLLLTEEGITYSRFLRPPRTVLWGTIERAEARVVRRTRVGPVHEISVYGTNGSDPVCLKFVDSPFPNRDMARLRLLLTDRAPQAELDRWFGYDRRKRLLGHRA